MILEAPWMCPCVPLAPVTPVGNLHAGVRIGKERKADLIPWMTLDDLDLFFLAACCKREDTRGVVGAVVALVALVAAVVVVVAVVVASPVSISIGEDGAGEVSMLCCLTVSSGIGIFMSWIGMFGI